MKRNIFEHTGKFEFLSSEEIMNKYSRDRIGHFMELELEKTSSVP